MWTEASHIEGSADRGATAGGVEGLALSAGARAVIADEVPISVECPAVGATAKVPRVVLRVEAADRLPICIGCGAMAPAQEEAHADESADQRETSPQPTGGMGARCWSMISNEICRDVALTASSSRRASRSTCSIPGALAAAPPRFELVLSRADPAPPRPTPRPVPKALGIPTCSSIELLAAL